MDKRELRQRLKKKLDHRRELMAQSSGLRADLAREKSRSEFLLDTLANPLVDRVLEQCADEIMKAVIDEAIKASKVVAEQTMDTGDYEIGLSIPSLHIRHRLMGMDLDGYMVDGTVTESFKRVRHDG